MREVIVIGAGLAGSSLAAALARRGHDVLLVEQKELPRHKVCGEFLSPESLHSLRTLGLYDQVARLSPWPMSEAKLVGRSGRHLTLPLPDTAWGVSRYSLDQALLEAAREAGAEIRTGVAASHISPLPGGRGYAVAVGRSWINARAVLAAWGRQTLPGLRAHEPPPKHRAWVGVKRHYTDLPAGQAVELYFVDGGYVGLAPVEGWRLNCSALISQPAFQRAGGGVDAFLAHACRQNPALAARLDSGRPVAATDKAVSGVDTGRRPIPWTMLPLLGDAAAMIPPLAGDGMAMALRTAELSLPLVEQYLAGHLSREQWAERFTRAYHAEFTRRLHLARLVQQGLVHPLAGESVLLLGRLLPRLAGQVLLATRGPIGRPL